MNDDEREFVGLMAEGERRACKEDGFYLAKYVIGRHWLKGAERGKQNLFQECHEDLIGWLWNLWKTRYERPYKTIAVVCWPRRTMKSTVCDGVFPIQVLLDDADTRILFDSYDLDKAAGFLKPVRLSFEAPLFQEIHGDLKGAHGNWNNNGITIKRDAILPQGSIMLGSIETTPTGEHWELIIADDLLTEETANTPEQREKVMRRVKMYDNLLDPGGMAVIVTTRWGPEDVVAFFQDLEAEDRRYARPKRIFLNVKHCYKKMTGPEAEDLDMPFTTELEFPNLLTQEELDFARASQGVYWFSRNYLCWPISEDSTLIKRSWIRYHDLTLDKLPRGSKLYLTCDPSGVSGKEFRGKDYAGIIVAAVSPEMDIFVLHRVREHFTDHALMNMLWMLYEQYPPHRAGIETVFGQINIRNWIKGELAKVGRVIHWSEFKNSGWEKEARVRTIVPYAECGKLYIRKDMTDLEAELLSYPEGAHDDLVDALAYVIDLMDKPTVDEQKKWWMTRDWALPTAASPFVPTLAMPAPPDPTSIAVWQAEAEARIMKTRVQNRRFSPASRRF